MFLPSCCQDTLNIFGKFGHSSYSLFKALFYAKKHSYPTLQNCQIVAKTCKVLTEEDNSHQLSAFMTGAEMRKILFKYQQKSFWPKLV